ncbi:MAG: biopolymer transport protein ExbB, partial [Mycobacterium sp.]|uniref:tonB-system energizer ExbB n=1 Tax=Mycobacterium sp. TaxID=1785 RepID=UPI0028B523A4
MKLKSSVAFLLRRWCRLSAIANLWRLVLLPILLGWPMLALGQEQTTPSDPGSVTMIPTPVDLPRDLSPWGMFTTADSIVKAVLIGLVIASFVTWTVWLAKTIELVIARRRVRDGLRILASVRLLAEVPQHFGRKNSAIARLVQAAVTELRLSDDGMDCDGIKDRVATRLERVEANGGRRMARGTGVLATIGATAPFVGLFGTVWGIMNSFIGISKSQTTNLAVVAPGIAEALLATAFGLAAAIPAVVIYNVFSRQIATYRALVADASAEVLNLAGRDLDRRAPPLRRTQAP